MQAVSGQRRRTIPQTRMGQQGHVWSVGVRPLCSEEKSVLVSVLLLKGHLPAETAQGPQEPAVEQRAQLWAAASLVRLTVALVGLESSVCPQSQQSALELGLERSGRPCPHSCSQYHLSLLELIELQHLEHSRPMPGPRYHL